MLKNKFTANDQNLTFGFCLFESNRFKLYYLMVNYILVYFGPTFFIINKSKHNNNRFERLNT